MALPLTETLISVSLIIWGLYSWEYLVGLLAEMFLNKEKGATIIMIPVVWNTIDVVSKSGGRAIASKTGHAFVKAGMRDADAIYGGEMSAHHYFRDFLIATWDNSVALDLGIPIDIQSITIGFNL